MFVCPPRNALREAEFRVPPSDLNIADAALDTVEITHEFAREDVVWGSVRDDLARANGNEAFTIAHGLVEVVQNRNDGETECFVEIFHKLHERKLMADVEIRSWLVEEVRLRVLCKCHRKTSTLTFAAGERAD